MTDLAKTSTALATRTRNFAATSAVSVSFANVLQARAKLTRPPLGVNVCQAGTGANSESSLRSPMGRRVCEQCSIVLVARGPDLRCNCAHVLRKWEPRHGGSLGRRESCSRTCEAERIARSIDRTKSWSTPPIVRPCIWRYMSLPACMRMYVIHRCERKYGLSESRDWTHRWEPLKGHIDIGCEP